MYLKVNSINSTLERTTDQYEWIWKQIDITHLISSVATRQKLLSWVTGKIYKIILKYMPK